MIDRTYALHEAAKAFAHIESGHARGKVVITVRRRSSSRFVSARQQTP